MVVFVNDIEIRIFYGARVIDAVRAFYAKNNISDMPKTPVTYDAYRNQVAHDGRLINGSHIYINFKPEKNDENEKR